MNEFLALIATRIFIAVVVAGISTAVIVFLANQIVMPWTRIKGLARAKEEGRVVEARLDKILMPYGDAQFEQGQKHNDGIYRYEIEGKTYKYRGKFVGTPPDTVMLYYRKSPSAARQAHQYAQLEGEWKYILAALTAVCFVGTFFYF